MEEGESVAELHFEWVGLKGFVVGFGIERVMVGWCWKVV